MGKNVHVVPQDGSWAVKTEKSEKAYRVVDTQKEAIDIARRVAENQQSEMLVHGRNGQIRQKDSFGNDPFPPKDNN